MALSFVVGYDLILLVLYILTKIFPRISDGQSYTPGWKKIRTRTGCFLCLCSFAAAICGAVYLRWVDVWMVELCPKMTIPEDCTQASKTWANVCWWLIVPTFIAAFYGVHKHFAGKEYPHPPSRATVLSDRSCHVDDLVPGLVLSQPTFCLSGGLLHECHQPHLGCRKPSPCNFHDCGLHTRDCLLDRGNSQDMYSTSAKATEIKAYQARGRTHYLD